MRMRIDIADLSNHSLTMKTLLTLFLLVSLNASAMVGQSYQDLVRQFGKPTEFDKGQQEARWIFEDRGFELRAGFDNQGICGQEHYTSLYKDQKSKLRLAELDKFVKNQYPRIELRQIPHTQTLEFAGIEWPPTTGIEIWVSQVTPKGRVMVIKMREDNNPNNVSAAYVGVFMENYTRERGRGNR